AACDPGELGHATQSRDARETLRVAGQPLCDLDSILQRVCECKLGLGHGDPIPLAEPFSDLDRFRCLSRCAAEIADLHTRRCGNAEDLRKAPEEVLGAT